MLWNLALGIYAADSVEGVLLERGILGVIALVLGSFAWQTIRQLRSDLTESLEREREQSREMYTRVFPVLERFTAVADARTNMDASLLRTLEDVRRLLEQRQV